MGTLPNPKTWTISDTSSVDAVDLNLEIRDYFAFLLDRPRILVGRTTTTSIPDALSTSVPWNQEDYKVDFTHSNSTNPYRITVDKPGLYLVICNLEYAAVNTTGQRLAHLQLNGTSTFSSGNMGPPGATINCEISVVGYQRAVAGDWFEVAAYQSSGAGLNVTAVSNFGAVWMDR